MIGKYILDTSIWIEIERKNPKIQKLVIPLIESNKVVLVDLIIAELLRGVRNVDDYDKLKKELLSFEILTSNWLDVSLLAFEVARRGHNPPLADLYIATCALENNRILITQDRDFLEIQKAKNFQVELI